MMAPNERDRERRNYYVRTPLFTTKDPIVRTVLWTLLCIPFISLIVCAIVREQMGDPNAHLWAVGSCVYLAFVIVMIPVVGWFMDEFRS